MGRSIIAFDIRAESISAVAVALGIRENRASACIHVPIDPKNSVEVECKAALDQISRQMNLSAAVCTVSLPADQVFYRNVSVPFRDKKKIRQILPFNLEPYMPVPVEELLIEFQPTAHADQKKEMDIVAVSTRKDGLDRYLRIFNDFQLKPTTITTAGHAAANLLSRGEAKIGHSVAVDLAVKSCSVYFLVSGSIGFARSFPVNSSSSDFSKRVGLDIKRSLLAFQEIADLDFQPDRLWLTGSFDGTGQHPEEIGDVLKLPVQTVDFSRYNGKIVVPPDMESCQASRMNPAMALVLSEIEGAVDINFNREGFAGEKFWRQHKKKLVKTGLLFFVFAVLALFNFGLGFRLKQQELKRLDTQVVETFRSAFPQVTNIVDPVHQMQLMVKEARDGVIPYALTENRIRTIDVLNDISRTIPATMDVQLIRLTIGPEGAMVTGDSDSFNTVDDAKKLLEQSAVFKSISISSTSKDKSGKRINFKLKIQL